MSQKDFEILTTLKPLETLWSPLGEEKAVEYCKHLQKFGIDVLRKAVDRVAGKWDRMSFPPVGVIVEAANFVSGTGTPGTIAPGGAFPWVKREADRKALVTEYLEKYMRDSATAAQAREEKWDHHLRHYVAQVASVQAQLIHATPDRSFGLSWYIVAPDGLNSQEIEKFQYGFRKDMQRQADTGTIDVAIPLNKIEQWQQAAYREQRSNANEMARMAKKYGTSLAGALPDPGAPPPLDGIEQLVGRVGSDDTEPPVWVDDSADYARDVMANT